MLLRRPARFLMTKQNARKTIKNGDKITDLEMTPEIL